MAKRGKGAGAGLIQSGDPHAYLGHFRGAKVLKDGHNVGAPMGRVAPVFNATTNPILATKQANRARIQTAKAGGGDVKLARAENKASMVQARGERQARNKMGLQAGDRMEAQAARIKANAQSMPVKPPKTPNMPKMSVAGGVQPPINPVQAARQNLKGAVGAVHQAREAIRGAIAGGKPGGLEKDFSTLQNAKSSRKTAKMGLREARSARRAGRTKIQVGPQASGLDQLV